VANGSSHAIDNVKLRKVEMTDATADDNASNARASISTDASKTISPAAHKFAEYIARRMRPMIEHAARANAHEPANERDGMGGSTKH
jgi:hypothetical protein